MKCVLEGMQNTAGKGENTGLEKEKTPAFSPFSTMFYEAISANIIKNGDCVITRDESLSEVYLFVGRSSFVTSSQRKVTFSWWLFISLFFVTNFSMKSTASTLFALVASSPVNLLKRIIKK